MKLLRIVVIFVGLAVVAVSLVNRATAKVARDRVAVMMAGWQSGGIGSGGDIQEAVSLWYLGTRVLADTQTLADASDAFDDWRREKRLYRPIERWEITAVNPLGGGLPHSEYLVTVVIDGTPYLLRVAAREPIQWAG